MAKPREILGGKPPWSPHECPKSTWEALCPARLAGVPLGTE